MPLSITVLTLFPQMFPGPLEHALLGEALEKGLWTLEVISIRDFAKDRHQSVDDQVFGGGPGMVLRPDVLGDALEATVRSLTHPRLLSLSPRGTPLPHQHLETWAFEKRPLVFVCGRYEGIDQRVIDTFQMEEISLGDFILMGGEIAAMTAIEGCVRLIPGVLGNQASLETESFSNNLLECPHYTRPRVWKGQSVPPVLLSGHHGKIASWRKEESLRITQERRPDLWTRARFHGMKGQEGD